MHPLLPLLSVFLTAAPAAKKPVQQSETHHQETPITRREGKTWQITSGLDGIPYLGPSLQMAYFLDADQLITASYRGGTDALTKAFSSDSASNESTAYTSAIGYKKFYGRNDYFEASFFHQTLQCDSTIEVASDEPDIKQADLRIDRFGAMLAIGTQWQKSNFTIGCDWVGLALPLAVGEIREKRQVDAIAQETLEADRKSFKEEGDAGYVLALRFYLGASF